MAAMILTAVSAQARRARLIVCLGLEDERPPGVIERAPFDCLSDQ